MQWRVVRRQRRLRRGERAGQQRRPRMAQAKACPFKLTISPYSLEQEHTNTNIACKGLLLVRSARAVSAAPGLAEWHR